MDHDHTDNRAQVGVGTEYFRTTVSDEDWQECVRRVTEKLCKYINGTVGVDVQEADVYKRQDKEPFLTVKIKQSHHRIPVNDILFLERNLRETFIYTKSETYTVRDKLNILQQQLPDFFVCCHRSFLVNLHAVSRLQHTEITLTTGQQIPVSRAHYEDVKKSFSLLML